MKKILTLLLLMACVIRSFAQTEEQKTISVKSITTHYRKNLVFKDTTILETLISSIPSSLGDTVGRKGGRRFPIGFSHADDFETNHYTVDSIPDKARVFVNGIEFPDKTVLSKLGNYEILIIKKHNGFRKNEATNNYEPITNGKPPRAFVYMKHEDLPEAMFLYKQYTLEPIRYTCWSESPSFDLLRTEDTLLMPSTPRIVLDGRLQSAGMRFSDLDFSKIKQVKVYGKTDAQQFFGWRVKEGLVEVTSLKGGQFHTLGVLNIHVKGEIQDKNGNWKPLLDTTLYGIKQFKTFREDVYKKNGPIYLINGEYETELVNRKSFDGEAITDIRIVGKGNASNDTVYIQTQKERWRNSAKTTLSQVLYDLKRIQNPEASPVPIYILDNKEVPFETISSFKNKEIEMVESLEGCDAIAKFGKRGLNGVVSYRRK